MPLFSFVILISVPVPISQTVLETGTPAISRNFRLMARSKLDRLVQATGESSRRRRELFDVLSAAAQVLTNRGFDEEPDQIRINTSYPLPVVNPEDLAPLLNTFQTTSPLSPALNDRVEALRTGGSSIYVPLDTVLIGPSPDPSTLGATALPENSAVAYGTRSKTSKK